MANTKKRTARPPAKVKGSLAAPRVAPERDLRPSYKRKSVWIPMVLVAASLVILLGWLALNTFQDNRDARKEVETFQKSLQTLTLRFGGDQGIFSEMNALPNELLAGSLAPADFTTRTDLWLEAFRELHQGILDKKVSERLEDARASLVQGTVIYIDGVKSFQLAAATTSDEIRAEALKQAQNLISHGTAVFGMGQRQLDLVAVELGLLELEFVREVTLPPEELSPAPELEDAIQQELETASTPAESPAGE